MHGWRRIDEQDGRAIGGVEQRGDGWTAFGVEVLAAPDPVACWFRVEVDSGWRTTSASIRALDADGERTVELAADATRRWTVDGERRTDLDGCVDVDVAATPLTNTFPVRRAAGLAIGEERTAPVAWVAVPGLDVHRVEQTYRRLGANRWEYRQREFGAFVLEVDDDGVVTTYEGFAERVEARARE